MKIEVDLDYNSALEIRRCISRYIDADYSADLIHVLDGAIANEDERRGVAQAERLLESGGIDDSRERQQLRDAGRGHLIR